LEKKVIKTHLNHSFTNFTDVSDTFSNLLIHGWFSFMFPKKQLAWIGKEGTLYYFEDTFVDERSRSAAKKNGSEIIGSQASVQPNQIKQPSQTLLQKSVLYMKDFTPATQDAVWRVTLEARAL
jgi:hypothetical protein